MADPIDYTADKSTIDRLSSETRLRILASLRNRQKTPAELAKELSLTSPTIHHHLENLKDAGLVESRDDGHMGEYYQLTPLAQALVMPDKKIRLSIILSATLTGLIGLVVIVTYVVLPQIYVRIFPELEDPYLPLFVIAIGAVIIQTGILGYIFCSRYGDR